MPDADPQRVSLVGFDLDDTLAHSKTPISPEMARSLVELLLTYDVLIISGARFSQFESQVLNRLPPSDRLRRLHLMPTCGTRYLRWQSSGWEEEYAHDLDRLTKVRVSAAIESEAKRLGLWEPEGGVWGERIEDRGSQITYSALGQRAPIDAKRNWDPTGDKRDALGDALRAALPDLEVRAGGLTSIDVTEKGIDKAYGLGALMRKMRLEPDHVLFVGDHLEPGGNDYPVVGLGVMTHAVAGPSETLKLVHDMIGRRASRDSASDA